MTRKKFVKNLMAMGVGRNAANYVANKKEPFVAQLVTGATRRGLLVTNCTPVAGGAFFKTKTRGAGGAGNGD